MSENEVFGIDGDSIEGLIEYCYIEIMVNMDMFRGVWGSGGGWGWDEDWMWFNDSDERKDEEVKDDEEGRRWFSGVWFLKG